MFELIRAQDTKDIRLILVTVHCSMKLHAIEPMLDPRIVSGGHRIEVHGEGSIENCTELDLLVASQAGVRCPPLLVFGYEVVDHVGGESLGEVPDVERNSQHVSDSPSVPCVIEGAASAGTRSVGV